MTGGATVFALGTPVTLPLKCTGPVDFGTVLIGQTATQIVNCTTNVAVTIVGCSTSINTFQCQNSSLPTMLSAGTSFSFPVTWNLTGGVSPGSTGGALNVYVSAISGYTTDTPIALEGKILASSGFLALNASQVDFGGIMLGGSTTSISRSLVISNTGSSALTFTGFAWQDTKVTGMPYNNVSVQTTSTVGNGFTATNFPATTNQLQPGQSTTIIVTFSEQTAGTWGSLLTFWTNSGSATVLFTGTAASGPVATLSISDGAGNWISNSLDMSFGNVMAGDTLSREIKICNSGGSILTITTSQPPTGELLTALDPELDLLQGSTIDVGACSYGTVIVIAPPTQPNHPWIPLSAQWPLNTDDSTFGLHTVSISATVITREVGPLLPSGLGMYQFVGCFYDGNRNLPNENYYTNMTIEWCLNTCHGLGYSYAGLEYHTQVCDFLHLKQFSRSTNDVPE